MGRSSYDLNGKNIAFIGAGNMAEAMIRGLLTSRSVSRDKIAVNNRRDAARLEFLSDTYGITTSDSKRALLRWADIVFLAVKPADLDDCMAEMGGLIGSRHLVISVLAGVTCALLRAHMPDVDWIVRAMPNTSARVGAGITAVARAGAEARPFDDAIETMFGSVGSVVFVEEQLLDAVTGLSGSGPAYIYLMAEAMAEAGVRLGLPPDTALRLSVETIAGAGAMMKTGIAPGDLRREVTSSGGTTEAGLEVLRRRGLAETLEAAVEGACRRSAELAVMAGRRNPSAGIAAVAEIEKT